MINPSRCGLSGSLLLFPEPHPLCERDFVYWNQLRHETLLLPERGPGLEFQKLLVSKIGCPDTARLLHQDVGLDRLLTMVGAGWGVLLALEGATGAVCFVTFKRCCLTSSDKGTPSLPFP